MKIDEKSKIERHDQIKTKNLLVYISLLID